MAKAGDILQGIRTHQQQIGPVSLSDRPSGLQPEEPSGIDSRCQDGLVRRQSGADQQIELLVKREAGEYERIVCIRAGKERRPRLVQNGDLSRQPRQPGWN